jgi:hypothetical protein
MAQICESVGFARPIRFLPAGESKSAAPTITPTPEAAPNSLPFNLAEAEEILIARAVQAAGGNISAPRACSGSIACGSTAAPKLLRPESPPLVMRPIRGLVMEALC